MKQKLDKKQNRNNKKQKITEVPNTTLLTWSWSKEFE